MARRRHDQLVHDPCGVFADDAFDPDNEGWFEVDDDSRICYACAALDQWREEHREHPEALENGAQVFVELKKSPDPTAR